MASELPVIAPTRSATPPPTSQDDLINGGLDGFLHSPAKSAFDPKSLSPMDENFPVGRYGSAQAYSAQPLNPLTPSDTNSLYSMKSLNGAGSGNSIPLDDGKPIFDFQPISLAKSPVTKSVRLWVARLLGDSADGCLLERWSKTRTQVQTQQCLSPNLPRAGTPSTSSLA